MTTDLAMAFWRAWQRPVTGMRRLVIGLCGGVLLVVVGTLVYTPVEDRHVRNDTATTVEVSGCDSDPITIAPGQTEGIQVDTGPPVECDVNDGDPVPRCLTVAHASTALVSHAARERCP